MSEITEDSIDLVELDIIAGRLLKEGRKELSDKFFKLILEIGGYQVNGIPYKGEVYNKLLAKKKALVSEMNNEILSIEKIKRFYSIFALLCRPSLQSKAQDLNRELNILLGTERTNPTVNTDSVISINNILDEFLATCDECINDDKKDYAGMIRYRSSINIEKGSVEVDNTPEPLKVDELALRNINRILKIAKSQRLKDECLSMMLIAENAKDEKTIAGINTLMESFIERLTP